MPYELSARQLLRIARGRGITVTCGHGVIRLNVMAFDLLSARYATLSWVTCATFLKEAGKFLKETGLHNAGRLPATWDEKNRRLEWNIPQR